ncbi:MAG: c-type cytochrome [Cytophagaceae bacterium]
MNHFLKIFLIILGVIIAAVGITLTVLQVSYPKAGEAPVIKVDSSPAQIERGKYLANHVAVCVDCHSQRDWNSFAGPLIPGTEGRGGEEFNEKYGFPGTFFSKNITPAGIGSWTDGEIYRAITSGVSRNGEPFFPVMPYINYNSMDTEDAHAIIAYLRTLKPIENKVPESRPNFPVNFILRTMPKPAQPQKRPGASDVLAYGKYLTNLAACDGCHTPQEKGKAIEGMYMAGGFEFPLFTGGVVRSANLTSDKETGIGNWSKASFISRFKTYADSSMQHIPAEKGKFNTFMPWIMYSGMSEEDLGAIYTYLQSVPAIKNEVEKFSPKVGK